MTDRYFTRVELRRHVPSAALRSVLMPQNGGARAGTSHSLIWTLFADAEDRERDFLWREHSPGVFYTLSERPPNDQHGLFEVKKPKVFAPSLRAGDHLAFELRVNATVSRGGQPGVRGKPCDIVMDAIYRIPRDDRADERRAVVADVARDWMTRQGHRCGFDVKAVEVIGYSPLEIRRGKGKKSATLGVLDLRGVLEVHKVDDFNSAVRIGFGRGKAFGCGLMLLRRV